MTPADCSCDALHVHARLQELSGRRTVHYHKGGVIFTGWGFSYDRCLVCGNRLQPGAFEVYKIGDLFFYVCAETFCMALMPALAGYALTGSPLRRWFLRRLWTVRLLYQMVLANLAARKQLKGHGRAH